ncbi:ROK family protein [Phreatobacter sp.]|uniref:ROK family protein n=1 Tax=Phreatobacter sp. TaxID=1966341 RepID=UPI003F6F0118
MNATGGGATADLAAGIDVGGTTIKLGLVTREGEVVERRAIAYAAMTSFEQIADTLAREIGSMQAVGRLPVSSIGLAAPGHARPGDGLMVDGTGNVPLMRERSLAQALRQRTGLPVATLNDGSAATVGELRFGSGRGLRRFCVLTLGTGVGGGIAIDGRLVSGDDGVPPELGAIVLDDVAHGPRTLEDFASAGAFTKVYEIAGGAAGSTPMDICRRMADGDAVAGAVVDGISRRIAQALGSLINALNLQACILCGGVAQAGDLLTDRVTAHLGDFTWPFLLSRSRVLTGRTGDAAGILGAAQWSRGPISAGVDVPGRSP